ncbi:MAG: hypothetical protein ACK5NN_16025 [Sphingomonadaceae bacterium]
MYDRQFFESKLGQAAIASILAMIVFIALSNHIEPNPAPDVIFAVTMPGEYVDLA